MNLMHNKFQVGDVVFEKVRPTQPLIITRFQNKVYFCKTTEQPTRLELVYSERELKGPGY